MTVFADASFLVAAFAPDDDHNREAWRWWQKWEASIIASPLVLFEAENTFRGFSVGGKCSVAAVHRTIEGLKRALTEGMILERDIPLKRLLSCSRRLSQYHTVDATFGAMDILHVATALELKATTLLSFDRRQRDLAKAEGLLVQPATAG